MVLAQVVLYWITIGFFVIATVMYSFSLKFEPKHRFIKSGRLASAVGLVPLTLAIALRWYQTGHGPYSKIYEVSASYAWSLVIIFLFVSWRYKIIEQIGAVVLPVSFLLLGFGVMGSKEITTIPDTFKTYWLWVHIGFAKLAYGSALIGTGLAAAYLLKEKKSLVWLEKLPDLVRLDELSYKFLAVSFLFNTVMIAAGSIWAKNAWGSYWSWDPIETWSLIAWLVYAAYLHVRRTMGWRGSRASWLAVAAMIFLLFAIFGAAYVYPTVHEYYLG